MPPLESCMSDLSTGMYDEEEAQDQSDPETLQNPTPPLTNRVDSGTVKVNYSISFSLDA